MNITKYIQVVYQGQIPIFLIVVVAQLRQNKDYLKFKSVKLISAISND